MSAVLGTVDGFEAPHRIWGWATDQARDSSRKTTIVVLVDGAVVAQCLAEQPRPDLLGIGDGAIAYDIALPLALTLSDFAEGRVRIEAFKDAEPLGPVRLHPVLCRQIARHEMARGFALLSHALELLEPADMPGVIDETLALAPGPLRHVMSSLANIQANAARSAAPLGRASPGRQTLTPLLFPVGLVSHDGSAQLGREGQVFLVDGTNKVRDLYRRDPGSAEVQGALLGWLEMFRRRQAELAGRHYLQIVIPEKITVHPELLPDAPRVPTPLLRLLEDAIAADAALRATYVSGRSCLAGMDHRTTFKAADSHLLPSAIFAIFQGCIERLGLGVGFIPHFDQAFVAYPDMAARFFGQPFYDVVHECQPPDFAEHRRLVRHIESPDGGHVGQRQIWHNPAAPFQTSVLAFGNSFFGDGSDQGCLSWWFSTWFRDFQQVWSASFDMALVADSQPSIVIGQTIERFMDAVPSC